MQVMFKPWLPCSLYAPRVLFDLNGTLVDSLYQYVLPWREALEEREREREREDSSYPFGEFTVASGQAHLAAPAVCLHLARPSGERWSSDQERTSTIFTAHRQRERWVPR